VVTASWDHQARIWDLLTAKEIHVLDHHKAALLSARYSPTGNHVVVTSSGNHYQLRITPGGGGGTTSSVNERFVASIWDDEGGTLESTLPNRSKQHFLFGGKRSSRSRASFSADGNYVVVAGADPSNLFVWDVREIV
jgi:WD40 repeat protein